MRWRSTPRFVCQSWTIILASILCCAIGLAQVCLGAWLWIFSESFILVIGEPARNVCIGYMIIGVAVFFMCSVGAIAAFLRRRIGMLLYAVLSVASVASQAGVWVFIYLEYERTSQMIADRIEERRQYDDFLTTQFNCNLQAGTQFEQGLEACANFVTQWMWRVAVGMLGLSSLLIVVQFILMILASMLFVLISEEQFRSKVRISPELNNESNSSTCTNQLVAISPHLKSAEQNKLSKAANSPAASPPISQSRESISSDTISLIPLRELPENINTNDNNNNISSSRVSKPSQNTSSNGSASPKKIASASVKPQRRQSIEIHLNTNVATEVNVSPKNPSVAPIPTRDESRTTQLTQPGPNKASKSTQPQPTQLSHSPPTTSDTVPSHQESGNKPSPKSKSKNWLQRLTTSSPHPSDISSSSTQSISSSSPSTRGGTTTIKSTPAKSTPSPIPTKSAVKSTPKASGNSSPVPITHVSEAPTAPSLSAPAQSSNQNPQRNTIASTFKKWFKRSPKASQAVVPVKPSSQATAAQSPAHSTLNTPYESYDTVAASTAAATSDVLQPLPPRSRPKKKPKIVKKFSTIEV